MAPRPSSQHPLRRPSHLLSMVATGSQSCRAGVLRTPRAGQPHSLQTTWLPSISRPARKPPLPCPALPVPPPGTPYTAPGSPIGSRPLRILTHWNTAHDSQAAVVLSPACSPRRQGEALPQILSHGARDRTRTQKLTPYPSRGQSCPCRLYPVSRASG